MLPAMKNRPRLNFNSGWDNLCIGVARIIIYPVPAAGLHLYGGGLQKIEVKKLPQIYHLYQNYPNPFRFSTSIQYELPVASNVSLKLYNACGQLVRTLVNCHQKTGIYIYNWDGRDDQKRTLPSGVYFYRFETKRFISTKKIVLIE